MAVTNSSFPAPAGERSSTNAASPSATPRRCILHVGMYKTGTSSIQSSLVGFSDAQFAWFDAGPNRTNHSRAIFNLLADREPDEAGMEEDGETSGEERTAAVKERFERQFQSLGQRTLIVSGEGMSTLSTDGLRKLLAYFRAHHFEKVEIAAYVRPPVGLITSVARAPQGGALKSLSIERFPTKYQALFEKFDRVFGRENVHLWKFDPRSFTAGCVVQDFCTRLGFSFPPEQVIRVNEALSREAVALLYTYRKFRQELDSEPMTKRHRNQLARRLQAIGGTRFRFSPDLLQPMLERNRSDIEWMEARLGQSLVEELGERQPDDVREEADLLRPDPGVVSELLAMLGKAAPIGVKGETPKEVALLVDAVRLECAEKVSDRDATKARNKEAAKGGNRDAVKAGKSDRERRAPVAEKLVGPEWRAPVARKRASKRPVRREVALVHSSDIIEQLQRKNPDLLNGIPPGKAHELVSGIFNCINRRLAGIERGKIGFADLGRFRVKKVKKAGGAKAGRVRIGFLPAINRKGTA